MVSAKSEPKDLREVRSVRAAWEGSVEVLSLELCFAGQAESTKRRALGRPDGKTVTNTVYGT